MKSGSNIFKTVPGLCLEGVPASCLAGLSMKSFCMSALWFIKYRLYVSILCSYCELFLNKTGLCCFIHSISHVLPDETQG